MFNPFIPFDTRMLDGFMDMKRMYLVSQSNPRGINNLVADTRIHILLSDYESEGLARIHFNALVDPYRAVLNLDNPVHREKVIEIAADASKYKLWAAFIADEKKIENRMNARYNRNMQNYITQRTDWRIGADKTIYPKLELIFGELFVSLKYRSQQIRIKLEELEKY